jgi:hypothetical protein
VVRAAGLLAATGLLTAVMAPDAAGTIGGLLLVGFAIAPVVPTTLSLAGRSAPGRSGQAVPRPPLQVTARSSSARSPSG